MKHAARPTPVLAVHGGAGTLSRAVMPPSVAVRYEEALRSVLDHGERRLAQGAAAIDVVTQAVRELEDCELFNAGKGAVYTADERHELDACVMEGRTRACGAVAGVRRTRNPVLLAREVMERTPHVFLVGEAADQLALAAGLEMVEPAWFGTPERRAQLAHARQLASALLDADGQTGTARPACVAPLDEQTKFGTVGAVALDADGHLAAAASTGGMTNKWPGRVGDTPIAGAGCYADDHTAAVACTGTGEAFIRSCAAYDVTALMKYAGLSLEHACTRVVMHTLPEIGGRGGLVAVSARGEVCLPFNTEGMYRGWVRPGQAAEVAIFEPGSGRLR